jgi:hypothetical protein
LAPRENAGRLVGAKDQFTEGPLAFTVFAFKFSSISRLGPNFGFWVFKVDYIETDANLRRNNRVTDFDLRLGPNHYFYTEMASSEPDVLPEGDDF